jgi:hypothetical protein
MLPMIELCAREKKIEKLVSGENEDTDFNRDILPIMTFQFLWLESQAWLNGNSTRRPSIKISLKCTNATGRYNTNIPSMAY